MLSSPLSSSSVCPVFVVGKLKLRPSIVLSATFFFFFNMERWLRVLVRRGLFVFSAIRAFWPKRLLRNDGCNVVPRMEIPPLCSRLPVLHIDKVHFHPLSTR